MYIQAGLTALKTLNCFNSDCDQNLECPPCSDSGKVCRINFTINFLMLKFFFLPPQFFSLICRRYYI